MLQVVQANNDEKTGEITFTDAVIENKPDEDVKTIIERVLNNQQIRENAVLNAKYIQSKLKNWFTFDQLITKTNLKDHQPAQDLMDLLCLFQLAYREVREGNLIKYKITLTKEDRVKLLQEEISETEEKLSYLKKQLKELNN